MSFEDMFKIIR